MSKEKEDSLSGCLTTVIAIPVIMALGLVFAPITQYVWKMVIPNILPEMVNQNYIVGSISYWTAYWISVGGSFIGIKR